ncbi:hypothetical protein [Streptomyces sp. GbtcB6]|uniref:hypothetical protein n=1 Tax=Streptomyces sp. GbtcB6 TaxID=2824751 RepID=UPI001C30837B|nr:hypothetical protein [Streptomyces sp. GbtcB6]
MSSGCVWILPAVIVAGWIPSGWGPRWIRWSLLSAGVVVSVLFVVTGFRLPVPSLGPDSGCTREQVQCMNSRPVFWLETGLIGFGCCVVLLLPTTVAEIVIRIETRAAAKSPR